MISLKQSGVLLIASLWLCACTSNSRDQVFTDYDYAPPTGTFDTGALNGMNGGMVWQPKGEF